MKHPTVARVRLRIGLITAPPEGTNMLEKFSEIRKTVINVLALVVAVGTPALAEYGDVLPVTVAFYISGAVALAAAVLHFLTPNETTDPSRAVGRSVRVKGEKPYGRHALPE